MPLEEPGVGLAGEERRVPQHADEQVAVRRHAVDAGPRQRVVQQPARRRTVRAPGDDLRQHRVVGRADLVAGRHAAVEADAGDAGRGGAGGDAHAAERGAGRHLEGVEAAGLGEPAAGRVLGVQPDLHGVAAQGAARSASGGSGAPAATSNCSRTRSRPVTASVTGCSTWSRVLTSRKWKSPSGAEQELDGAGADVVDGRGGPDGGLAQPGAQRAVHRRATAPPRRPSGCAAGSSTPARTARRGGRAGRRRPGPRRAGPGSPAAPGTRSRRRRPTPPRGRRPRRRPSSCAGVGDDAHAAPAAAEGGLDHQRVADARHPPRPARPARGR